MYVMNLILYIIQACHCKSIWIFKIQLDNSKKCFFKCYNLGICVVKFLNNFLLILNIWPYISTIWISKNPLRTKNHSKMDCVLSMSLASLYNIVCWFRIRYLLICFWKNSCMYPLRCIIEWCIISIVNRTQKSHSKRAQSLLIL